MGETTTGFSWTPQGRRAAVLQLTRPDGPPVELALSPDGQKLELAGDCLQPPGLHCGLPELERARLFWLVRQYAEASPPDQNHDRSDYAAGCCCRCLEGCGACVHAVFDGCAACMACTLTCGCYPRCPASELDPLPPPPDQCGWYCCCYRVDWCTSRALSWLALPTRCCGRLCGMCCRNLCPMVQEDFAGPPHGCAKCVADTAGGVGNCFTHVLKGVFTALTRCRRRVVNHCCVGLGRLRAPCATLGCRGGCHACCSVAVNGLYCMTLGWEDVLIYSPILECLSICVNADVFLQGPVLLQGWLAVTGSCLDQPRAWVVLRPWSVSIHESPDQMAPDRPPLLLLPTSTLMDVSPELEAPELIQLRTLDFQRYSLRVHPESPEVPLAHWREALTAACERYEQLEFYDQGVGQWLKWGQPELDSLTHGKQEVNIGLQESTSDYTSIHAKSEGPPRGNMD